MTQLNVYPYEGQYGLDVLNGEWHKIVLDSLKYFDMVNRKSPVLTLFQLNVYTNNNISNLSPFLPGILVFSDLVALKSTRTTCSAPCRLICGPCAWLRFLPPPNNSSDRLFQAEILTIRTNALHCKWPCTFPNASLFPSIVVPTYFICSNVICGARI